MVNNNSLNTKIKKLILSNNDNTFKIMRAFNSIDKALPQHYRNVTITCIIHSLIMIDYEYDKNDINNIIKNIDFLNEEINFLLLLHPHLKKILHKHVKLIQTLN